MTIEHRIAYIDENGVVLNVIVGDLSRRDYLLHLEEKHLMYGAVWGIEVADPTVKIWIGGSYDNENGFTPPPVPDIVEGASEEIIPVIEEPTI